MWKQTRKYSSLFTKPSGIPINREVDGGEEWVKSGWWLFTSRNADKHRGFGRKGEEWRDFCRMLNINHIDRIGKSGFPIWDDYLIGTADCSLFRYSAVRPKQPTSHTQTAHLSFGDKYQNIGDLSAKNSHIKTKTKWNFPEIWKVKKNILPLHPQKR